MTEYKFYMLAEKAGLSYKDRLDDLSDAKEAAKVMASNQNVAIYVLEAIWMCEPKQYIDEQKITETAPQAEPPM